MELEPSFSDLALRTPLKFGAGVVREITALTIRARVETLGGRRADGYGAILLSDLWAFPCPALSHPQRDTAMRRLALGACALALEHHAPGHPLHIAWELKPFLEPLAATVSNDLALGVPIPLLATQVCAAPLDAALHDACGRALGLSAYDTLGPAHIRHDLAHYCGPELAGRYPEDFLRRPPEPSLPAVHLVGAADKLTAAECTPSDPDDGLPVSLDQWVARDGLRCLKVKLTGTDIAWDVQRVCDVAAVVREAQARAGIRRHFTLSVDSNEMNDGPASVVEFLLRLREADPNAYARLAYLEQPVERDLRIHEHDMHPVSKLKPVVVDEGVTDLSLLALAGRLGWSGIALKTCKGHSASLLYLASARTMGMVVTMQDLTNPGRALVHSASLAARVSPLMGLEYNARQFIPDAEPTVQAAHPCLFQVCDGSVSTASLSTCGLGY